MKRYISTFALAALVLAACQEIDQPNQPGLTPGKVVIDPIITRATEVDFEEGDKIGLTISTADGDYASNACLTYSSDVFSGDLLWYTDGYAESTLSAYYPYRETGTPSVYFTVADQSKGISAADFMLAVKTGVTPSSDAVTMTFKHMMTKLVINVDNQSGSDVEKVVLIAGDSAKAAGIDYENAALTAYDGALPADQLQITACEVLEDTTWAAIIVPHTGVVVVEITLANGKVMTQKLVSMTFKSGGQYTINSRVLADDIDVTISGTIENWTEEGEIEFDGEAEIEIPTVDFTEYDTYFVYDGVEYDIVTLADGNTWMAENLRYIPAGKTVSSDPVEDAGIWYPAANADKVADPALVESLGLLYDSATAFGADEITEANAASFEGCQGICPPGWHIPTVTEMTGLVGHCSNAAVINTAGAYYDATIKGASLAALSEAGWTWQFASMRNKTNTGATGAYTVTSYNDIYGVMSYLIGSSNYQVKKDADGNVTNIQYYYFMPLYNASNEKVSVAYGNFLSGASLRCVKNR